MTPEHSPVNGTVVTCDWLTVWYSLRHTSSLSILLCLHRRFERTAQLHMCQSFRITIIHKGWAKLYIPNIYVPLDRVWTALVRFRIRIACWQVMHHGQSWGMGQEVFPMTCPVEDRAKCQVLDSWRTYNLTLACPESVSWSVIMSVYDLSNHEIWGVPWLS